MLAGQITKAGKKPAFVSSDIQSFNDPYNHKGLN